MTLGISPCRFLRCGFRYVNNVAVCVLTDIEAECTSGRCGLPSGLYVSLCTLHLAVSAPMQYSGWSQAIACCSPCNLYRRMANPCSAGTFTRQETPSFSWRTNVSCVRLPAVGSAEPLHRPLVSALRFDRPVPRLCVRHEIREHAADVFRDLAYSPVEDHFVRLRRRVKSRDLTYELERSIRKLLCCCRRVEIEQRLDISAHGTILMQMYFFYSDYTTAMICESTVRFGKLRAS
jgi:hypothetical protein